MIETLFIADLHLQNTRPSQLTTFLKFLSERVPKAEALYILGDLFEVWVGDDDVSYQPILTALHNLTSSGIPVFILPGNRDFLLSEGFIANTGCQLLADPTVIHLYGVPTLLMHGDTLCTKDTAYQKFRQQVRTLQWQQQFLAQPLAQRYQLAQQAREHSQTYTQTLTDELADVAMEAVIAEMTNYDVRHLIHGHTHKPTLQQLTIAGQTGWRWVLGAWDDQGGMMLRCSAKSWQLVHCC